MTLDKARELIGVQVGLRNGYNRHATRLLLRAVQIGHGQASVDRLIHIVDLQTVLGLKPGADFGNVV